jgi:hypothetical protein
LGRRNEFDQNLIARDFMSLSGNRTGSSPRNQRCEFIWIPTNPPEIRFIGLRDPLILPIVSASLPKAGEAVPQINDVNNERIIRRFSAPDRLESFDPGRAMTPGFTARSNQMDCSWKKRNLSSSRSAARVLPTIIHQR